jgi:hypothetical protein
VNLAHPPSPAVRVLYTALARAPSGVTRGDAGRGYTRWESQSFIIIGQRRHRREQNEEQHCPQVTPRVM